MCTYIRNYLLRGDFEGPSREEAFLYIESNILSI